MIKGLVYEENHYHSFELNDHSSGSKVWVKPVIIQFTGTRVDGKRKSEYLLERYFLCF